MCIISDVRRFHDVIARFLHDALKCGRVSPLLKKPGLDQADMANFRPITNLPTVSKILEKLVSPAFGHTSCQRATSASFIRHIGPDILLRLLC